MQKWCQQRKVNSACVLSISIADNIDDKADFFNLILTLHQYTSITRLVIETGQNELHIPLEFIRFLALQKSLFRINIKEGIQWPCQRAERHLATTCRQPGWYTGIRSTKGREKIEEQQKSRKWRDNRRNDQTRRTTLDWRNTPAV